MLTALSTPTDRQAEAEFTRWRVGLRPVELPAYLRTKAMVIRTGTNELQYADSARWAEPLDQGIRRVIKDTLDSAQNVENVALNAYGDDTLDYEVAIRVLACEGMRAAHGNSSIRFAVTWEARSVGKNSTSTKRGVFTADPVAWEREDYGQLAERLSEAIVSLSKAIAAELPMNATPRDKHTARQTKS